VSRRWDDATGIVTPEAVELRFQDAYIGSRTAALLLDLLILGTVLFGLNLARAWILESTGTDGGWVAITFTIVVNFLVLFGYPLTFETLRGRTPGKMALGLRVVTVEGSPARFRHAAIRSVFWLVDFFGTAGVAALLATMLSKRHQRLGDMVAGTVVLRERTASAHPEAAHFTVPRGAEDYASTIDPSGLSSYEYEVVREFLLRSPALEPRRRYVMATNLARALALKLGHMPPEGVSPELFLQCLGARYQAGQQPGQVAPVPAPDALQDFAAPGPSESAPAPEAPDRAWGDFAPPQ
jgi:uncharacterized RDD family membrane protein YckC